MSDAPRPLILDADGVFFSERPYWNAALGTSLEANGLAFRAAGRWEALADYAFGPVSLQRVTKTAGCNSNWDLAAVLVRALDDATWRGVVDEMLAAEDHARSGVTTRDQERAIAESDGTLGIVSRLLELRPLLSEVSS